MTEQMQAAQSPDEHEPSFAEVAARRVAARTQWQKALARAKERFTPANVADEAVDTAANTIGGAADKAAGFAWAHRGKLALAGLLGGLIYGRKPIAKATGPLVGKARASIGKARETLLSRKKP